MDTTTPRPPVSLDLTLGFGGPAALGLTMGLTGVSASVLLSAVTLPAAVLGTTLLMLPALYIGSALAGADTHARQMLRDALGALREAGIGCLGLTPALLFLCATSGGGAGELAVGFGLLVAAMLGLRGFYVRLFDELELGLAKGKAVLIFAAWALVALGIGARMAAPAFG